MPKAGRLYRSVLMPFLLTLVGSLAGTLLVTHVVYTALGRSAQTERMRDAADLLAHGRFPLTEEVIDSISRLLGVQVWLIDHDGRIDPPPRSDPTVEALRKAIDRSPGTRAAEGSDTAIATGDLVAVARRLVPARHPGIATVAVVADMSEWGATLRRTAGLLTVGGLLAALGLALVAYRISRGIVGPVCALSDMAAAIAAGDRAVRSGIRRDDEIGGLAESLNRMADRLATYENDLVRSNRAAARGEVAARVAHEIRNPLTAIKLHLEMLAEDLAATPQASIISGLLQEIRRLDLVVSATLAHGRDLPTHLEPTSLNELTANLCDLLAPQFTHRGIALTTDLDPGLPLALLNCDKTKQVLLNLLINATDALANGGRVRIRTQPGAVLPDGASTVDLFVEDDGPGIDPRLAARLHEDQYDASGGSGIGLRLSHDLMVQQGGGIIATQSPLGGACLRVWFRTLPGV